MEKVYAESAKNYDIEHSVTLFEKMLHEAIRDHKQGLRNNREQRPYSMPTASQTLDPTA